MLTYNEVLPTGSRVDCDRSMVAIFRRFCDRTFGVLLLSESVSSIQEILENIPTITQVNNILIAIVAVRDKAVGISFESALFSRQISHKPLMRP